MLNQRPPVLRVALTGGIATGKSYVLKRFAELSAPTIDADVIARAAISPGKPGWAAIRDRFGYAVLTIDNTVDRQRLASIVFADAKARADLEEILHPTVQTAIDKWFQTLASDQVTRFALADIPLLFETGREKQFDQVIVTACEPRIQLQRMLARGISKPDAMARLAAQLPTSDKTPHANFLINTDGTYEETDRQVYATYTTLKETAAPVQP